LDFEGKHNTPNTSARETVISALCRIQAATRQRTRFSDRSVAGKCFILEPNDADEVYHMITSKTQKGTA
jgi:hypothetical protein